VELSDVDKRYLVSFVEEVLCTIHNDDVGLTHSLEDLAMNAGTILGLSKVYMEELE
jgi:hypothetical protein